MPPAFPPGPVTSAGGCAYAPAFLDDDTLVYGKYSRGFKAGGFNLDPSAAAGGADPRFKPEIVRAYEAGIKSKLLDNRKSPSPKTGELDNRGSQFYLAMYWAQELAAQSEDRELATHFSPLAKALADGLNVPIGRLRKLAEEGRHAGAILDRDPRGDALVDAPSAQIEGVALVEAEGVAQRRGQQGEGRAGAEHVAPPEPHAGRAITVGGSGEELAVEVEATGEAEHGGRGGGNPQLAQGSAPSREAAEKILADLTAGL